MKETSSLAQNPQKMATRPAFGPSSDRGELFRVKELILWQGQAVGQVDQVDRAANLDLYRLIS